MNTSSVRLLAVVATAPGLAYLRVVAASAGGAGRIPLGPAFRTTVRHAPSDCARTFPCVSVRGLRADGAPDSPAHRKPTARACLCPNTKHVWVGVNQEHHQCPTQHGRAAHHCGSSTLTNARSLTRSLPLSSCSATGDPLRSLDHAGQVGPSHWWANLACANRRRCPNPIPLPERRTLMTKRCVLSQPDVERAGGDPQYQRVRCRRT